MRERERELENLIFVKFPPLLLSPPFPFPSSFPAFRSILLSSSSSIHAYATGECRS